MPETMKRTQLAAHRTADSKVGWQIEEHVQPCRIRQQSTYCRKAQKVVDRKLMPKQARAEEVKHKNDTQSANCHKGILPLLPDHVQTLNLQLACAKPVKNSLNPHAPGSGTFPIHSSSAPT